MTRNVKRGPTIYNRPILLMDEQLMLSLQNQHFEPTDDVNRTIIGNVATWWPNLQLMQLAPPGGQSSNHNASGGVI